MPASSAIAVAVGGVIAGHHDDTDSGGAGARHRLDDTIADRILESQQAGEPVTAIGLTSRPARQSDEKRRR